MKFSITHVLIENFRAIERLATDLWDKTYLTGDNETSKTGFASAILWCLTNKDSEGNSTFEIVPSGKYGKVSPSVELECAIDDKPVTLKREYKAKYARDKSFKEYATVCYINGIETGSKKFQDYISEKICDSDVFKILSNPYTFVENCPREQKELPWQAQRRLLMSLIESETELELAESDEKWSEIASQLNRYDSVSQLQTLLKQQSSSLQKSVDSFEARMEQQQENFVETSMTEDECNAEIEKCESDLNSLEEKKRAESDNDFKDKLKEIQARIERCSTRSNILQAEYQKKVDNYNQQKLELESNIRAAKAKADEWIEKQAKYASAVEELRGKDVMTICPTCGQVLPARTVEMTRKKLNSRIENGKKCTEQARSEAENCMKEYNELMQKKISYPVRSKEIAELESEIALLNAEMYNISTTQSNDDDIMEKQREITDRMNLARNQLYANQQNNICREKIDSLMRENRDNSRKLSELQRLLDLCKEFTSFKCKKYENALNSQFETVRFSLFEQNKSNDDVREVCNLTFNGHKYEDLSASTKLVASMELLNVFQKKYNVLVPIVIDNMESVTADIKSDAQIIQMYVREELCPKCGGKSGRRNPDGTWKCEKCNHVWEKSLEIKEG